MKIKLIANKVKDGWLVDIISTTHLPTKKEVKKLATTHGLKIQKFSNKQRMFAE